jgi:hypothetical protein
MARQVSTSHGLGEPTPAVGGGALVARLGWRNVSENITPLGLYYLTGLAYSRGGARSLRGIARFLRTLSPGVTGDGLVWRVAEGLPRSLQAIHRAVLVLEHLTGEQLVNRPGEGLGYDGLTEAGQRWWRLTATFIHEFWA